MATHAHGEHDPFHGYVDGDDLPAHGALAAEPKTPTWMPVVGLLLLAGGLVYALSAPTTEEQRQGERAFAAALARAFPSASASATAIPTDDEGQPAQRPVAQPRPRAPNGQPFPPAGTPLLPNGQPVPGGRPLMPQGQPLPAGHAPLPAQPPPGH